MKREAQISLDELRRRLSYEPETGVFRWAHVHPRQDHLKGMEAGTFSNGYRQIAINGLLYRAHRLAWFYWYGQWPAFVIDHINGDKSDNRIANLRDVPQQVNSHNIHGLCAHNTSGVTGVSFHKKTKMWRADIKVKRKQKFLGRFRTFEEAVAVREAAKRDLHLAGWH